MHKSEQEATQLTPPSHTQYLYIHILPYLMQLLGGGGGTTGNIFCSYNLILFYQ